MALSQNEIEKLVEKIRGKYDEYAYRYSPKYFDRAAFEQRFLMAREKRMDLEAFILAEITNFEQLKTRYEQKKDKGAISRKIDEMIEEQLRVVRKYPSIDLHQRAGAEFPHFLGAINLFAESYLPVLWLILDDPQQRNFLNSLEQEFSDFAVLRGSKPPKKGEDLLLFFSRKDIREVDAEKARNNYMKETAFILHDISRFCEQILSSRGDLLDNPVRFDKLHQSNDRRKKITALFNGHTGYGCALKVKDSADTIITDFRLTAFRKSLSSSSF